jgi:hypothetical protein
MEMEFANFNVRKNVFLSKTKMTSHAFLYRALLQHVEKENKDIVFQTDMMCLEPIRTEHVDIYAASTVGSGFLLLFARLLENCVCFFKVDHNLVGL